MKVLYILGWQRSGTTVVGDLLAGVDECVHVGELQYLWAPSHPTDFECECGRFFWDCELWGPVLARLGVTFEHRPEIHAKRLETVEVGRLLPRLRELRKRGYLNTEYSVFLGRLHRTLGDVSGASLVIDSSKEVGDAVAAISNPDLDVYVLHLVRDPRATTFSVARRKKSYIPTTGAASMRQRSTWDAAARWLKVNALSEHLVRPLLPESKWCSLRYEDFVASPGATLEFLRDWLSLPEPERIAYESERIFRREPGHTVMGNPNRYQGDSVEIIIDDSWVHRISASDRLVASAVALPLLRRYSYSVLGERPAGSVGSRS